MGLSLACSCMTPSVLRVRSLAGATFPLDTGRSLKDAWGWLLPSWLSPWSHPFQGAVLALLMKQKTRQEWGRTAWQLPSAGDEVKPRSWPHPFLPEKRDKWRENGTRIVHWNLRVCGAYGHWLWCDLSCTSDLPMHLAAFPDRTVPIARSNFDFFGGGGETFKAGCLTLNFKKCYEHPEKGQSMKHTILMFCEKFATSQVKEVHF